MAEQCVHGLDGDRCPVHGRGFPVVFVPANGIELHTRRDCSALPPRGRRASRVEAIATTARRLDMFDPCPRCVADVPRRQRDPRAIAPSSAFAVLRDRPSSTLERMRTEAARRGVTFNEWADRFARLETVASCDVIDLGESERVIDLTDRQSDNMTIRPERVPT